MASRSLFLRERFHEQAVPRGAQEARRGGRWHAAGPPVPRGLRRGEQPQIFDIWESQETFDKFGEKLLPILAELGYTPPEPMIAPVHNIIVGK
jgi:hypothetical protein